MQSHREPRKLVMMMKLSYLLYLVAVVCAVSVFLEMIIQ